VQNSLFSTQEFIKASRDFVCVRIETFENEQSEMLVRNILGGNLANTAFVILSPDGTERLTASGRSPGMAMIQGRSRTDTSGSQNVSIINQMQQIADRFAPQQDGLGVGLQDFHSLRQALNCAAADQRPLVVVHTGRADRSAVESKLKSLFEDEQIIGKFHLDFIDRRVDRGWESTLNAKSQVPAILIVRPGQFGLEGQILKQVAVDANAALIKRSLLEANREYASVESRKDYEQHVRSGKRRRVEFENEISREGAIDYRPNRQRRGR
jgi:hypothetical protein